jgi:hypothetical protein
MDGLNEILVESVKAAGGSSQVGPRLWPEKSPSAAQRLLLDCLNEDRPAHLNPDQMLLVLRLARAKGVHVGMEYLSAELSYAPPVAVEPRDEVADLQRQFIAATEQATANAGRMAELVARIEQAGNRRAAAVVKAVA